MTDLPKYHCPDCRDWSCFHCYCVDEPDCNACADFIKGERQNDNETVGLLAEGEQE